MITLGHRVSRPLALLACLAAAAAMAQTGPKKPKVPPGRDPGGVAVCVLGAGVDYRRAGIAARLARDGEGEMIGWDVIDDDPFPLEAAPTKGRRVPPHAGTEMADRLLAEAPAARLVAIRVPDGNALALGGAMAFARATPCRIAIVLLGETPPDPPKLLTEVIAASPHHLVIATMRHAALFSDAPPTVVRVAPVTPQGGAMRDLAASSQTADLAIPVTEPENAAPAAAVGDPTQGSASMNAAAIRLAALAARLLASAPDLDAATLKARLLALAAGRTAPGGHPGVPWIENAATHQWRQ